MIRFDCAAILFDLDGVLVDSTRAVERQWRAWAREQGIAGDKAVSVAHGVRAVEVIRMIAPHLDAEAEVRKLEAREAADRDGVTAMPGALDLIHSVSEGQWGVATSGTRHLATERLRCFGIPIPKAMVTADDVARGKPDPAPYLKGAELLGVNPAECLVIEDAPAGIQSAHAGGMKVIGLTSTYPASALNGADAIVKKLSQVQLSRNYGHKIVVSISD